MNVAIDRSPRHQPWLSATQASVVGRIVRVTAASCGPVARVNVAAGQLVSLRELLIELDPHELDRRIGDAAEGIARAATRQQLAFARRRYFLAQLHRLHAEVRAPASGRVLATRVRPRQFVSFGQPLVSILEADRVWIVARFHPRHLPRVRVGQPARVVAAGRLAVAKVSAVDRAEERVLMEFEGTRAPALRPGMPASVAVG